MTDIKIPSMREYQLDLIYDTREEMKKGIKAVLIQAPTGSGKTLLTAKMLKTARAKGMAAYFIVHRRELIKQSIEAFACMRLPHGIIGNGWPTRSHELIQIASIQTLVRRYHKYATPSLIIWDEAHHCSAGSWNKLYQAFPNAYHIGLTATPQRLDGTGLNKWFKKMINGPSVRWLIDNGFLCDYKLYAPSKLNFAKVHTRMGDYVQSEVVDIIDKPTITGDAIKHYLKLCNGKRAVAFCASIKHSKHVVEQFNKSGISAIHVDGETPTEERDQSIRRFRDGKIKVLSNVDLFGEGFDLPSLEAVILLRPTKSLGLFLQQVGRALRTCVGKKEAVILDHAGNCQIHGLPDDERDWSLDGRSKGKGGTVNEVNIKTCPKCYGVMSNKEEKCIYCGFVYEKNEREINQVEGELVEVDPTVLRSHRLVEQGTCDTLVDLIALGKKRGYKFPYRWAKHVFNNRQAKKLRGVAT